MYKNHPPQPIDFTSNVNSDAFLGIRITLQSQTMGHNRNEYSPHWPWSDNVAVSIMLNTGMRATTLAVHVCGGDGSRFVSLRH